MGISKLKICVCTLLALFAFFAFFSVPDIGNRDVALYFAGTEGFLPLTLVRLKLMLPSHGAHFGGIVFFAGAFFLFMRHEHKSMRKPELVFSALLTLSHYVGISFTHFTSFALFTASAFARIYSLLLIVGFFPFFYVVVCLLIDMLEKGTLLGAFSVKRKTDGDSLPTDITPEPPKTAKVEKTITEASPTGHFTSLFLEKRVFLAPFLLFLVAWLPYFFVYFPGSLINDSVRQISHFLGIPTMTHHPIISSIFMGSLFRIGIAFGNANLGLALITICHNLLMASSFSLSLVYMRKWGVAARFRFAVLLFFAFFPVFGVWAQTILKDTHSAPLMLIFVLLYIDVLKGYTRKGFVLCAVMAVVASLFRHEVIYVVLPAIWVLQNHSFNNPYHAAMEKYENKRYKNAFYARLSQSSPILKAVFLNAGIFVIIFSFLIPAAAFWALDEERYSHNSFLLIPFQQTARFVRYHNVTEADWEILEATFHEARFLGYVYDPRISDPIAHRLKSDADTRRFLRTWLSMGRRAPFTYFEAAVAFSFSYLVPFGPDWMLIWPESSHDAVPDLMRPEIGYTFSNEALRSVPRHFLGLLERLPAVNLLLHTGNFTWAMAFLVLLLFKAKKKIKILYFLPAFMIILACMASPVDGYWRYYLPILFMFHALLGVVLKELSKRQHAS